MRASRFRKTCMKIRTRRNSTSRNRRSKKVSLRRKHMAKHTRGGLPTTAKTTKSSRTGIASVSKTVAKQRQTQKRLSTLLESTSKTVNDNNIKSNTPPQTVQHDSLDSMLANCKRIVQEHVSEHVNDHRRECVYGSRCFRKNPEHLDKFKHPIQASLTDALKECTDGYMAMSYKLYSENGNSFPSDWHRAVYAHLQESDYTNTNSLYFNILANLCRHSTYYTRLYPKKFIEHLLTAMEEQAVTGMFNIEDRPDLVQCLKKMKSPDFRYLSNTALLSMTK